MVPEKTEEASSNETESVDESEVTEETEETEESTSGSTGSTRNFNAKTLVTKTVFNGPTKKYVNPNTIKSTVVVNKHIEEDEEPYVAPRPPIISMQQPSSTG